MLQNVYEVASARSSQELQSEANERTTSRSLKKNGTDAGLKLNEDAQPEKEIEDMLQRVYAAALYKTYFEKTSEGVAFERSATEIWFETML